MAGPQPFKLDYDAFGEHVLRADWMVEEMEKRAERVKEVAEALAPVDENGPHPGRYKAAFGIKSGIRAGERPRAYAEVYNDSPEAVLVEFGSKNNPRHRVLGRALGIAE